MKATEIRAMQTADIEGKIKDLKRQLFDLRFQAAVGQLTDTAQLKNIKKDIARMYTVLTERENTVA